MMTVAAIIILVMRFSSKSFTSGVFVDAYGSSHTSLFNERVKSISITRQIRLSPRPTFGWINNMDNRRVLKMNTSGKGDEDIPPSSPGEGNESNESPDEFISAKGEKEDGSKKEEEDTLEGSDEVIEKFNDDEMSDLNQERNETDGKNKTRTGKLVIQSNNAAEGESDTVLKTNPYLEVVSKITPSELISKFTSTADPRVQEAVRSTILGLIGNLPKMAFETTTVTTGQRLASLMFQLQMTGYMFRNAEYRLSLSESLGMKAGFGESPKSDYLITSEVNDGTDNDRSRLATGKVRGKIKVSYSTKSKEEASESLDKISSDNGEIGNESEDKNSSMEVEVDAAAYMSELRSEVSKLRDELSQRRLSKENEVQKDLLLYIRTLPEQELRSLTGTMSEDVLIAMKGLVNVVLSGIGEGKVEPDTVTEQSSEAMAQLLMWQLGMGYNLRELEVKEEIKASFLGKKINLVGESGKEGNSTGEDKENNIDFIDGGFE